MNRSFLEYFRCPEEYGNYALGGRLSDDNGFFRFGRAVCYGKYSDRILCSSPTEIGHDGLADARTKNGVTQLLFDPDQVTHALRFEAYASDSHRESLSKNSVASRVYYLVRPILPVAVRKHLQRARLNGWNELPFPRWPVDCSVEDLLQQLLQLSVQANGIDRVPFIWFWPDGASSCAVMTHDVETRLGRDFSRRLMDINDSFGIKSSFQVIPEKRYEVPESYLQSIRSRGFEVNIHDLNHDGHLFRDQTEFASRVQKINEYGQRFGAVGFRSAVLYRRQAWFNALQFAYDMSVPNVAHLDPQRGGCCTVMPFFIGELVELPVTMTQDYSLFHILRDYSTDLWKQQANVIMEHHGLMSFIVHPDYITGARERGIYERLMAYLVELREEKNVWIPIPGEVSRWWKERSCMRLVKRGDSYEVEGVGKQRARIAYASINNGSLIFEVCGHVLSGHA